MRPVNLIAHIMCIFSVLYTNRRTQTSIGECAALSIFVKLNSRSKIYLNIREKHISTFCTLNSNHRWLRRLLWSWIMDAHSASHPSQTFTTRNSHENIAPEAQNWVNNTSLISILWLRWMVRFPATWFNLCAWNHITTQNLFVLSQNKHRISRIIIS